MNCLFLLVSILLGHICQGTGLFYLKYKIWDRQFFVFFFNNIPLLSFNDQEMIRAGIDFISDNLCLLFLSCLSWLKFYWFMDSISFFITSFWFNSIHWFSLLIFCCNLIDLYSDFFFLLLTLDSIHSIFRFLNVEV